MDADKIGEVFQEQTFLRGNFQQDTDEVLYYDVDKEILYSFQCIGDDWKQVFVLTDCYKRWGECIHPDDGLVVEKFLNRIKYGQGQSEMVCRFEVRERYFWYFTHLQSVEYPAESGKFITIGYRRDLSLVSEGCSFVQNKDMDILTKVYNKDMVQARIDENIKKYEEQQGVLCVLDLDNFRIVNEKYGHTAGDEVLCNLVKTIRSNVSTADIIGRVAGDTFVLYINDVTGHNFWKQKIGSIIFQTKKLYQNHSLHQYVSVSAGVSLYPKDGNNFQELYVKAKEARTFGKLSQFGEFEMYEDGMLRNYWGDDIMDADLNRSNWHQLQEMLDNSSLPNVTEGIFKKIENYNSSISILLDRICIHYGMSSARVYEYIKENKTICCTYERCDEALGSYMMETSGISDDNVASKMTQIKQGATVQFYSDSMFVKEHGRRKRGNTPKIQFGLAIELAWKEQYLGKLLLFDYEKTHILKQEDLYNLKWLGQLLSFVLYSGDKVKLKDQDWRYQRTYDSLTGLYRLETFLEKTRQELAKHKDKQYLIVYSDVWNFKYVNETFGYDVGDNILRDWADILIGEVPNSIFAGRVCYDHIVGLRQVEVGLSEEEVLQNLDHTKRKIEHQLKKDYPGSNFTLNTGAFCVKDDLVDVSAALSYANMARKLAKRSSTRCMLYTDAMRRDANREIALVSSLEDSIRRREFTVYLQPKVSCKNQKVVGAEALVRWKKQNGELIYPDEFIRVFEKYGCIVELDYFVYEEVFRFIRHRMDQGKPLVPISLNVSRAHMADVAIIDKIEELLEKYKVPTKAIEFEITESLYMEKLPALERVLDYFRKSGFVLSMDDFGTGYSSLNAISTMPVDVIKMDKIFMKEDGFRENDRIIITHIITMANELQKKVLCEGVETNEQKEFISSVGCDCWQGYLFSRPVPIPEFERIILQSELQSI